MKILRHPLFWAALGFGVGAFWVWLAFAEFTARDSSKVLDAIAVATCPPIYFDLLTSPFVNAVLYGSIAYLLQQRKPSTQVQP